MSDVVQDPVLRDLTRSLSRSGSVWATRVVPDQRDMVRTLSHFPDNGDWRLRFLAVTNWLTTGLPGSRGRYRWKYDNRDIQVFGPNRWGYRTSTYPDPETGENRRRSEVDVSDYEQEYHVNETGEESVVVSEEGCIIRLTPGSYVDSDPTDSLFVVDTGAGDAFLVINGSYLEIETEGAGISVVQSPETMWLLRIDRDIRPLALDTVKGILFEGAAFRWVPGFLLLRSHPDELWPDGIAQLLDHEWQPVCPRHHALRTDEMRSSGRLVADYLRHTQDTGALLRACAEVAGLRVFAEDHTIEWIEEGCSFARHFLDDGSFFDLKGTSPYDNGAAVRAGEVAGNRLSLRCKRKQGALWYANRPWGVVGFDSGTVWPPFPGLMIRDEMVTAECYDDGGDLRARILFNQNPALEEALWAWHALCERHTGRNWAADVFEFTAAGETKSVNPLEVILGIVDSWGLAIEGDLKNHDEQAWKAVVDFLDREKPAGAFLIQGAFPSEGSIFGI